MKLLLREIDNGLWLAATGHAAWTVRPDFPANAELLAQRWLAEERDTSSLGAPYWAAVRERQEGVGRRLFQSLLVEARSSLLQGAETINDLTIEPRGNASPAWTNLIDGQGRELALSVDRFRFLTGEGRAATILPLRVLVVPARPQGANDIPPFNISRPLALLAEQHGARILVANPPTKQEIARILREAAAEGAPITALVFDGHGAIGPKGLPRIALESELNVTAWLTPEGFLEALMPHCPSLIVLAACRTGYTSDSLALAASFAQTLAATSGASVVGMAHNISPATAQSFVLGLFSALWVGVEVDVAVQQARQSLARSDSEPQDWRAPIYFERQPTRFAKEASDVGFGPRRATFPLLRGLECAETLRQLAARPVRFVIGPRAIGKTAFLAEFSWVCSLHARRPVPLVFDARQFDGPAVFLAAQHALQQARQFIAIDNVGHWRDASAETWDALLCEGMALGAREGGLLLASDVMIPALEARPAISIDWLLGLGDLGLRQSSDLAPINAHFFGAAGSTDRWLPLLVLIMRAEPILMSWAAEHFSQGSSGESLFWRFVMPDRRDADQIAARVGKLDELEGVPPMLGWSFGIDGSRLLARVAPPSDASADESLAYWRDAFTRTTALGLGVRRSGGQHIISAAHMAILRSRLAIGEWPPDMVGRYLEASRYLGVVSDVPDAPLPDCRFAFSKHGWSHEQADNPRERQIERNRYISILTTLPLAAVAGRLAALRGEPGVIADITAGFGRILRDFDLTSSSLAWLIYWEGIARNTTGRSEERGRAQAKFTAEEVRSGVFDGSQSPTRFVQPSTGGDLVTAAEAMLAAVRHLIASEPLRRDLNCWGDEVNEILERVGIFSATNIMGAALDAALGELGALLPAAGWFAQRTSLEGARVAYALQHNRFADAELALERMMAAADPAAVMDQSTVAIFASEVYAVTRVEPPVRWALQALKNAQIIGNRFGISYAQLLLSTCFQRRGDMEEGRRLCIEARRNMREFPLLDSKATLQLAMFAAVDQNPDLAEAYRARAAEAALAYGADTVYMEALSLAPIFAQNRSHHDEADMLARVLGEEARRRGYEHGIGIANWFAADTARRAGQNEEAIALASAALTQIRPQLMLPYAAHCHRIIAEAHASLEQFDAAAQAQHLAATEFDRNNFGESDESSQWLTLEFYALAACQLELADIAASNVARLGYGSDIRVPLLLTMCAAMWMDAERFGLAKRRAHDALSDVALLDEKEIEMLTFIADLNLDLLQK